MRRSLLPTTITALLAATLTACAPRNTGVEQCSAVNVKLLEITDRKFTKLQQSGLSAETVGKVDQLVLSTMRATPVPIAGCAIGITRADRVVFLKAYGDADTTTGRDFTYATPSAVGSIAKTLTALAALRMRQDGQLPLTTPAYATLAPGKPVPNAALGDPTLEQLLRHRAGFNGKPDWDASQFQDLASINAKFQGNPQWPSLQPALVFPGYSQVAANRPVTGPDPVYSNTGYSIAGALIDQRSLKADIPPEARGHESYIWHKVARGLSSDGPNMVSACLDTSFRQDQIHNLARGYWTNGLPADFSPTGDGWGWEGPSGGWSMTIGDLARLMLILQSDLVIPESVVTGSMRKYSGTWGGLHLGLGLELSSAPSTGPALVDKGDPTQVWFGKGGDIQGYTADFKIWPNAAGGSWGVAFMCNQQRVGKGLTNKIEEILVRGELEGSGATGGGSVAGEPAPDWLDTAIAYEPMVRRFASSYLQANPSAERAWASARRELLALGNGSALVRTLESGEFEAAVRLLPSLRWPDGSPVTP